MTQASLDYASCIVRIWRMPATPAAAAHDAVWLAQVEWLPAGPCYYFSSVAGLLTHLDRALDAAVSPTSEQNRGYADSEQ